MADPALEELAEYHNDIVFALKVHFGQLLSSLASDFRQRDLVASTLTERLDETDRRSAFFILAAVEAAFRIDYQIRCQTKMKDDLSRTFRNKWKSKEARVSLDEDIFEAWRNYSTGSGRLISELRSAFNFRHWVAHGSYWTPKLGRTKYDFLSVYNLADDVLSAFPLQKPN
jgi:hypothetical protein